MFRMPRQDVAWSLFFAIGLFLLGGCGTSPDTKKTENAFQISAHFEAKTLKTGQNTLLIEVKKKDGSVVKDATITVKPHMPAHGHGSSEKPKVEHLGEGKYKAFPVTFQMPGDWEVIIEVASGGQTGSHTMSIAVK